VSELMRIVIDVYYDGDGWVGVGRSVPDEKRQRLEMGKGGSWMSHEVFRGSDSSRICLGALRTSFNGDTSFRCSPSQAKKTEFV